MRYNANKGEIMLIKMLKRESQMRNNANKGENTKVKCEKTQIKGEKKNTKVKCDITTTWNVLLSYITLYVCTSNNDHQFHIVNCWNNLYDRIL